jgi:hypothetical protein
MNDAAVLSNVESRAPLVRVPPPTQNLKGRRGLSLASSSFPDLANETLEVRNSLAMSVKGIMEAGNVIDQVKTKKLKRHGQFAKWIVNDLHLNISTAQWLRKIARHAVLSKACHWDAFPVSIRTLYELTKIDSAKLRRLITTGEINPGMTREEATALRYANSKETRRALLTPKKGVGERSERKDRPVPTPKLPPESATILDALLSMDGGDVVLGHIHRQTRTRDVSQKEFVQAARVFSNRLAGGK